MVLEELGQIQLPLLGSLETFAEVLIILAGGILLSRLVRSFVRRNIPRTSVKLIKIGEKLGTFSVWVVVLFALLQVLHIGSNLLVSATVLGVVLTYVSQNLIVNAVAGLYLVSARPFTFAEMVKIGEVTGEVADIGLMATKIRTQGNVLITIPNSYFLTNQVMNYDSPEPRVLVEVGVGVSYDTKLPKAKKILLESLSDYSLVNPVILKSPEPEVWTTDFADSSITLKLRFWISDPREMGRVPATMRDIIKQQFDKNHIEIAFPQVVVHYARKGRAS